MNLPPIPLADALPPQPVEPTVVSPSEGSDHTRDMDTVFNEILGHARDLMEFGYNADPMKSRGIFEIAATMYGHAMSAANAKREAQLKTLRLALDRRRVDLEARRTDHVVGQFAATADEGTQTLVIEDRNQLLRQLREQIKDENSAT